MPTKEPKEVIFDHLSHQNRPFSANDIFTSLHSKDDSFGRTVVQKSLDLLVAEERIKEKVYGKQKVYAVNQDLLPSLSDSELKSLEEELKTKEQAMLNLTYDVRKAEGYLKGITSLPVTEEVMNQIDDLQSELRSLEDKLKQMSGKRAKNDEVVTEEKVKTLQKSRNDAVKTWRKRRRVCLDVIDAVLENYPKSKKILLDDIGIETEESLGLKMIDS